MVEEAILGGMLLWQGVWPSEVMELQPEYFRDHKRAQVFEAMQALMGARFPVDEVSVTAQLAKWDVNGMAAYVLDLAANTPTAVNLPHWAGLLVEDGVNRQIKRQVSDALSRIDSNASVDDVVARVRDAVRDVKPRFERGPEPVSSAIGPTLADLEFEAKNPDEARIAATGIHDLDRMAKLVAGDLTIIAGRPSMGKSALASNVAQRSGKDITRGAVVVFSLEMSTISLVKRMMSSDSGFSSDALPQKAASGELVDTCARLHGLNLYIDDRPHLSMHDVHQALVKVGDVRLVIFDYLQLAHLEKAERHDLSVGQITKGMKAMAKEFNAHVIGLSQLNRSVESRSPPIPRLSDLRDSGNIEEDADNVWMIYRPHYHDSKEPPHVAQIHICKQRNGITGMVEVYWSGETQTFRDLRKTDE